MKTKYDWRNIPDWVNVIAIDEDGQMYGYKKKPKYHAFGIWYKASNKYCLLEDFVRCENWKESLEKRPKTLGTKEEIEGIVKFILQDEDTDCGNEVLCSVIASRCAEQIMERLKLKP